MGADDEGGQALVQLAYGLGDVEGEQAPVAHEDPAVHDGRADVGGAGAVHQGRGEVVHGLGVRSGEVDQDEVGAVAGRDTADAALQADRAGALQRGVVQGLTRGQPARSSSVDFWMSEVSAIDSHTSRELLDAAPSVASPTGTPMSRSARTGVVVGQANFR